jgi:hypothetical protein
MIVQNPLIRNAVSCAAAALLTGAWSFAAMAQIDTTTLASHIVQQFGFNGYYTNGKLGNDWCFNVDRELGYSWWYYDDGSGLTAHQISNTVRIQATYLDPDASSNYTKYASLFLGLDASGAAPPLPQVFALDVLPAKILNAGAKQTPAQAKPAANKAVANPPPWPPLGINSGGTLNVPSNSASSQCMTLAQFLIAYVMPLLPTMTANSTINYKVDTKTFSSHDYRYWMFNGRAHSVVNIISYSFDLQDAAMKQYTGVNLVVGFGGGAGP